MADSSSNIFNVMKGFTKFSGTDRLLLERWYEETRTVIGLTRKYLN